MLEECFAKENLDFFKSSSFHHLDKYNNEKGGEVIYC